ncbi:MAG: hypothetical protein ACPIA7_09105 [Akkermansiaceae bacterium]
MNKSRSIFLISLVAIAVILLWWLSPSQIIKRQTETVVQCLDIPETATKTYRALKTNSFSNLLESSATCRVDVANYQKEFSRNQLIESHQLFAFHVDSADAKVVSIGVKIIDETRAVATAAVDFAIRSKKTRLAEEEIELKLSWNKNQAGKWRLSEIVMEGTLDSEM